MKNSNWVFLWISSMWLVAVIVVCTVGRLNRPIFPAPIIQGMSVYEYDGKTRYEIRTDNGYHLLTKEVYSKYKVGDKYE